MPLETPQALPPILVHGTFWKHWPSILLNGLSCQGRTHIHLAPGLLGDPGVTSGQCPSLPTPSTQIPSRGRSPPCVSHPLRYVGQHPSSTPSLGPILPRFADCSPRPQHQLSLQACVQTVNWPSSSMAPWPWQVSVGTAGTTLGLCGALGT